MFDTRPLSRALSALCDFELLNRSSVQVSVVAANAVSGAAHSFSNHDGGLDAARIMASGALPPWFPAVEIDGAWYWDGSLATAAPMRHLVANAPAATRTTILRADLWSCDGPLADNLGDVVGIDYERSQCEAHFEDSRIGKTAIDEHWANGRHAAETALSQIDTA
ncbi:patatin-like phospholipase family protein [Paraburkholderia phenoliruptrix]|uniref:patatin-like phospholipase family protein n=1 Tax=Paraburkholderia phenoliruptrix TaxID=252970 RepID=UPI003D975D00